MVAPVGAADMHAHARHIEAVLDAYLPLVDQAPARADWAMVLMFYAGLHWASGSLLKDHNERPTKHGSRRAPDGEMVHGVADLVSLHYGKEAAVAYHSLYDLGKQARYQPLYRTFTDLGNTRNVLAVQRFSLEQLKSELGI